MAASHLPAWHVAPALQGLPSEHELPSGNNGPATHWPVEQTMGEQVSPLQFAPSGRRVPALHCPAPSHCSVPLQGFPSEHDVPAGMLALVWHTPAALHVPGAWQGLPVEQEAPGIGTW